MNKSKSNETKKTKNKNNNIDEKVKKLIHKSSEKQKKSDTIKKEIDLTNNLTLKNENSTSDLKNENTVNLKSKDQDKQTSKDNLNKTSNLYGRISNLDTQLNSKDSSKPIEEIKIQRESKEQTIVKKDEKSSDEIKIQTESKEQTLVKKDEKPIEEIKIQTELVTPEKKIDNKIKTNNVSNEENFKQIQQSNVNNPLTQQINSNQQSKLEDNSHTLQINDNQLSKHENIHPSIHETKNKSESIEQTTTGNKSTEENLNQQSNIQIDKSNSDTQINTNKPSRNNLTDKPKIENQTESKSETNTENTIITHDNSDFKKDNIPQVNDNLKLDKTANNQTTKNENSTSYPSKLSGSISNLDTQLNSKDLSKPKEEIKIQTKSKEQTIEKKDEKSSDEIKNKMQSKEKPIFKIDEKSSEVIKNKIESKEQPIVKNDEKPKEEIKIQTKSKEQTIIKKDEKSSDEIKNKNERSIPQTNIHYTIKTDNQFNQENLMQNQQLNVVDNLNPETQQINSNQSSKDKLDHNSMIKDKLEKNQQLKSLSNIDNIIQTDNESNQKSKIEDNSHTLQINNNQLSKHENIHQSIHETKNKTESFEQTTAENTIKAENKSTEENINQQSNIQIDKSNSDTQINTNKIYNSYNENQTNSENKNKNENQFNNDNNINTLDKSNQGVLDIKKQINPKIIYESTKNVKDISELDFDSIYDDENKKTIFSISNKMKDKYIGGLDDDILRNGVGYNRYKNGDIYYGNWQKDKKDGAGIYFCPSSKTLFAGDWNEDKRISGLYLLGNDKENPQIFGNSYDIFYGKFKDDMYSSGLYFKNIDDDITMFNGEFKIIENKVVKTGNCETYKKNKDSYFNGYYENDSIKSGVLLNFKNNILKSKINLNIDLTKTENNTENYEKKRLNLIKEFENLNLFSTVELLERISINLLKIDESEIISEYYKNFCSTASEIEKFISSLKKFLNRN